MGMSIGRMGGADIAALWENLFKKVDTDSSGGVSKTEFTSAISSMASNQNVTSDEADAMFSKLDTDSNGTVSKDEMMATLKAAGEQMRAHMPPPPPRDGKAGGPDFAKMSQDLLKSLDTSGDGSLDKTEFSAALSALSNGQSTAATDADTIFSKLDTNRDGKVDASELAAALKNMGPPAPPAVGDNTGSNASSQANGVSDTSEADGLNRLFSDLVASLNGSGSTAASTASGSSETQESDLFSYLVNSLKSSDSSASDSNKADMFAQLIKSLQSSDKSNDDQLSALFSSLVTDLGNSAQYSNLGSASYSLSASQTLLSMYA
jgi:Ca2+-binding EF-hand superfamily protein